MAIGLFIILCIVAFIILLAGALSMGQTSGKPENGANNQMSDTQLLETPLGDLVSEEDLEELGRVECLMCHRAVLEDEYMPCPICEEGLCLYCLESDAHEHNEDPLPMKNTITPYEFMTMCYCGGPVGFIRFMAIKQLTSSTGRIIRSISTYPEQSKMVLNFDDGANQVVPEDTVIAVEFSALTAIKNILFLVSKKLRVK